MKRLILCPAAVLVLSGLLSSVFAQYDPARDSWQQPELVMDTIGVYPGMTIGEIGAGKGYFTFKLAQRVGTDGRIFANDIIQKRLDFIDKESKEKGISNITTVLGEVDNPKFHGKLDMIIMVYVFHDLEEPVHLLRNLAGSLSDSSDLVIIDRDPEKYGSDFDHFLRKEEVIKKVELAGYGIQKVHTFLQRDNIYICRPVATLEADRK